MLEDFLFQGKEPLFNNLIAGRKSHYYQSVTQSCHINSLTRSIYTVGHPVIHLGYAFELSSHTLAIEALALVSAFYNKQHIYLDDPSYTKPSPWSSDNPLEVLNKMNQDPRFDALRLTTPGSESYDAVSANPDSEALLLEYWNSLTVHNLPSQFESAQRTVVAALVGTHEEGQKYDFFLVHLLTSSHAIRIILPMIPKKWHIPLIRQWWLFVVTTYIAQQRPRIEPSRIYGVDLKGRDWEWVEEQALKGKWKLDAHFVKGLRAMKVVKETWGDEYQFTLRAAVHLAESFEGWGGFGSASENETEVARSADFAAKYEGQ